ncbi:MAG: Phytochrome-like protein cph1 [Betaproteobacteria bacterium ADurb.Bin341]|nr:MAG: Phytochrome-like protein cph1 [Betaproteobacteria bacterium ADurb.Bin341]
MRTSSDEVFAARHRAARVAGLYMLFGALWILGFEGLLALLPTGPEFLFKFGMAKGVVFVAVSALFLNLLLRRERAFAGSEVPVGGGRTPVGVFFGLALIVPLVAAMIVFLHAPHMRQRAMDDLRSVASLKVSQIESWLAERQADAEMAAKLKDFVSHANRLAMDGDADTRRKVTTSLSLFKKDVGFDKAFLVNADGEVLAASTEHVIPCRELRSLLAAALASGQVRRSDLHRDPGGSILLTYVAPLPEGKAALVLDARADEFLFPLIQTWPSASLSAETLIVRRDGDEVLFLNDLRHRKGTALELRIPLHRDNVPAVAAFTADQATLIEDGVDYRGIPVLAATQPVAGTPWHVIAKVDRSEVLASLHTLILWVGLVTFVAVAVIALAIFLFWRQVLLTQRLALQAKQAEADRVLHHFFNLPFIGMAVTSPDTRDWTRFNDRLCDILGYSRQELSQTNWAELTHPEDRYMEAEAFESILSGELEGYQMEKRFLRKDGALVYATIDVRCVRKADGAADFFVATIEDITDRKRAEAEVRQLNAELEQRVALRTAQLLAANADLQSFSYSISHDLRAPLRAISGFADILIEDYGACLDSEGKRLLQVVCDNARRMGQLIEDVLAFSRAGASELHAERLDMNALVQEVWRVLEPRHRGQVDFQVAELPPVCGDPVAVRQIWMNLLDNAIKFSSGCATPQVKVVGECQNGEARFYVRDNGAGFDMAYAHKLFNLFQRLHGTDEFEGTGVGLAIVKRFVAKHGGRVWAESQPGAGAMFGFSLPAAGVETQTNG